MHRHDRGRLGETRIELRRDQLVDPLLDEARRRRARRRAGGFGPLLLGARCEQQDVAAQLVGAHAREVRELHVAVAARDVDLESGGAEQPREERPHDVDALDAVQSPLAVGAEQDAAAHLHLLVRDAERVHAPRQVEPADEQQQRDGDDDEREGNQAAVHDLVDRVAFAESASEEDLHQPLTQVGDDDAEDRDQRQAAAQQRSGGMQAVPLAVGEVLGRGRRRFAGPGSLGVVSVTARPGGSRRGRRGGRAAPPRPSRGDRGW